MEQYSPVMCSPSSVSSPLSITAGVPLSCSTARRSRRRRPRGAGRAMPIGMRAPSARVAQLRERSMVASCGSGEEEPPTGRAQRWRCFSFRFLVGQRGVCPIAPGSCPLLRCWRCCCCTRRRRWGCGCWRSLPGALCTHKTAQAFLRRRGFTRRCWDAAAPLTRTPASARPPGPAPLGQVRESKPQSSCWRRCRKRALGNYQAVGGVWRALVGEGPTNLSGAGDGAALARADARKQPLGTGTAARASCSGNPASAGAAENSAKKFLGCHRGACWQRAACTHKPLPVKHWPR
jgi:hypothetical protein